MAPPRTPCKNAADFHNRNHEKTQSHLFQNEKHGIVTTDIIEPRWAKAQKSEE
jgi:hypothetical protein